MHEVGYCEALLPVVEARAGERTVESIGIRAGVTHGLLGDAMQMAWQMVADGTPYAGATTHLEPTAMAATCGACGARYETDDTLSECPTCGSMGARLSGGDEFGLAWLRFPDDAEPVRPPVEPLEVDLTEHTADGHTHDHQHHHPHQQTGRH